MRDMPDVIPMLSYEDGAAALDWLARAFGFVEQRRMMHEGRLAHGEMQAGDGMIMLATPSPDYEGPRRHRATGPVEAVVAAAWRDLAPRWREIVTAPRATIR